VATEIVRTALAGSGIERIASCDVARYDRVAPAGYQSAELLPGARGLVVAGSAGPTLFRAFRARMREQPKLWERSDPYDAFVSTLLERADAALTAAGIRFRRFEAAVRAPVQLDFLALARLVGLGSQSPFRLYVDETVGPWWALRCAWLVDAEVEPPLPHRPPCESCAAPCVGGWHNTADIPPATAEVRSRCIYGQAYRYDEDQIAYHYDRARTTLKMKKQDG
jgi:hypothetical protein